MTTTSDSKPAEKPAARKKRASKPAATKPAAKPASKPASKPRKASGKLHKIGRTVKGNDLRVYTIAIFTLLDMWKGKAVSRRLFSGFYMSASVLQNHGGNGNLAVTSESVTLTPQGRAFFEDRFESIGVTKKDVASIAAALKTGAASKMPERFADYKASLFPHPAQDA